MKIILERKVPQIVHEIDAALSRMHMFHQKRSILEEARRNYMSGYNGERQIDYYLKNYKRENCLFFAGLRLEINDQAFQIDSLILTPYFILIIESKNIAGTLTFEKDSTQVIRELNGSTQGFKNPIIQVARQRKLLLAWLKKHKIPPIPILDLVGIADRRTIIQTTPDNFAIYKKLIYADVLEDKIEAIEAYYSEQKLNSRQIQKLNKLFIKEHTPAPPSILRTYGIDGSGLIKGIRCLHCQQFPLFRIAKQWYCRKCKSYSKNAHKQAIQDYFLLISITMTNKQCREFLQIDNPDTVKKILRCLNLPTTGSKKTRLYHRPKDLQ